MNSGNEKIIAELTGFWEESLYYCQYIETSVPEIKTIIEEIDMEPEK